MNRKIYLLLGVLMFGISANLFPQVADSIDIPNNAFITGEILKYDAKYGFIKGGEATLSIELFPHGYSYVYHAKAIATTSGLTGKFFSIKDIYESYFDILTGLPIVSVRNIHEENYMRFNEVRFDHEHNKLISLQKGECEITGYVFDILSAYYYSRTFLFKNLEKNKTIPLNVYFDDEFYDMDLVYKGKDKIRTNFGKLECLLFAPAIKETSIFKKESDLRIWFTNDGNFIPVRMKIELEVGSVSFELTGFTGTKTHLNSNEH